MSRINTDNIKAELVPSIMVNGRTIFLRRVTEITQTRPGHFAGLADGEPFNIEGGRAAGGTARDWFVAWPVAWAGSINATSLKDAIHLIESC